MKIILSNEEIETKNLPNDIQVKRVKLDLLDKYNHNSDVIAVVGTRAMAIKCIELDLPSLKLFQLTSAGFDGVPIKEYADKGVMVANAGGIYSNPIAETVVFGILLVAKRLRNNPNNRHFKLTRNYKFISELTDKKILIMGAGNIGTAIANRLSGFECVIDGYDPYCPHKPQYSNIIRSREGLIKNIGQYDYIVSTLPDNEHTKGFIDLEILSNMKKSAFIINVGRKSVFNNIDFYNALKKRTIGGAVLDMFELVPNFVTNKFRRLSNVVILPGVAAISQETNIRLKKYLTDNIIALINGEDPANIINS